MANSTNPLPKYVNSDWPDGCTLGEFISTLKDYEEVRKKRAAATGAVLYHSAEAQSRKEDQRDLIRISGAITNAPGKDRIVLLCDEADPNKGLTAANVVALRAKLCRAKSCTVDEADLLSLDQVADVLDPKPTTSEARVQPPVDEAEILWTPPMSPQQLAKLFDVSPATFKRRCKDGKIRNKKLSPKLYQIAIADLPAKHQAKFRSDSK